MLHLPPKRKPTTKRKDPEKEFSKEILASIKALGSDVWNHSFDNVGQVVPGRAARRPADREVHYKGSHFILELKMASREGTLPYSKLERHQIKTLIKIDRAGGFGLVLVKQARPNRCWVIPAALLVERELHIGVSGSFRLEAPLLTVERVLDPRGWEGCVWDLRALFEGLRSERGLK